MGTPTLSQPKTGTNITKTNSNSMWKFPKSPYRHVYIHQTQRRYHRCAQQKNSLPHMGFFLSSLIDLITVSIISIRLFP